MVQFPENFYWGAGTSAYQVEGNNVNSDWWEWEKKVGLKEPCGLACRHYEFYKSDFDLAKSLNHNAHRLSIEWSRIEPQVGKFSTQEIDHYIDVIRSLRERNIEPIVTLHHFTNPIWFAKLGGWLNIKAQVHFLHYVEKIVDGLCDKVRFWVTINEPMVYVYHAYILGAWPPQEKSFFMAKKARDNLVLAHIEAYKLIHSIYKKRNLSRPFISIAKNVQAFNACRPTLKNRFATYLRHRFFNFEFIKKLNKYKSLDFIGINYYTRSLVDAKTWHLKDLLLDTCENNYNGVNPVRNTKATEMQNKIYNGVKKNSLGWDIYPQGLYNLALELKRFELPIFILENGICSNDDNTRWEFIYEHLNHLALAMQEGLKVLGYIYWSLIDNFEWDKGYSHRFGLISVDYNTYQRTIRDSARKFSEVCKTGVL